MKEFSEKYLGKKVTEAVVTVPAYFNAAQRKATYDAGRISGLYVTIYSETAAAIIAHGLDKQEGQRNILVFHLGGSTFDVSIVEINYRRFEIIANSGDTQLGGENFNQRVIDHFMKVILNKYNKDIREDKRAIQKLKTEVEKAKIELSSTNLTRIEIKDLADGLDFKEVLTRTQFEVLNANLFKKIVGPCLKKNQIHEYILVGGSSRIPKIRQIVDDFFDGKKSLTGFSPDEAVCYGAAILGGIICDEKSYRSIHEIKFTPFSLGVETSGGIMTKIIPKGSYIPTKKSLVVTTSQDNQQSVNITILEGERLFAKDNQYLGQFNLTEIPPAERGVPLIEVTFEIDFDGILKVSAIDKGTGRRKEIVIVSDSERLSKVNIKKLQKEAEEFAEQDKIDYERNVAKDSLESYMLSVKNEIENLENLSKELKETLKDSKDWFDKNLNAEKEDYEEELKELKKIVTPIINRIYKQKVEQKKQANYDDYYEDL